MKSVRYIVFVCALLLSQWIGAASSLISNDPNWLGGNRAALTTEGNDFWLTFMNNNMINPEDPANKNNPEFKFEMKVAISAREEMDVVIAAGNVPITTVHVNAGATVTHTIDNNSYAKDIYLFESEVQKYKGVHVYAAEGSKDKVFSCFLYSRVGGTGLSSRDASLVIPTRFLGKEYIVQTYPEDLKSTQLAIVATESNTTVKVVPTFDTYGGKTTAGTTITLNLSKGEAYLIASKEHEGEDFMVDLSGTTICSDKPIAVFNGNQQTGIPNREAYSQDFMMEQAIPIEQWGTEFYLTNLENTRINYALVTAAFAMTEVEIVTYNAETGLFETNSVLLNEAGKTTPPIAINDSKRKEVTIRSLDPAKPILCYSYITSAAVNEFCTSTAFDDVCYTYGDPANAMMPAWNHRVKSMNMFTEPLDPQGGAKTPQHFFAYVITKTEDTDKLTLNGGAVTATFYRFHANNDLSYAHIPLPNTSSYHLIESSGDGFIGTVYGLTDAQGYYYTLGFKPPQPHDSIYVTNTNEIMSRGSYDMDSLDGHGWYQRQWNEWIEGKERLDTAIICDSMSVSWAVETPAEKPIKKIEWAIYDVTGVKGAENGKIVKGFPINGPITGNKQEYEYQFILPEEDIEDRHQFFEYEVQAVLYRDQLMCGGEDIDTLKTTVRVTRQFNDTLYRIVCLGDTLRFFYDSMPDQRDLSILGDHAERTLFITVKEGEGDGYVEPWVYKLESGKRYTFHRDYQTQAGCDSLVTLEVFICDTFRFVDTIHLCDNQDTLYHGEVFRGEKSKSVSDGQVIKKDTVLLVKFQTKQCACQQEEGFPAFKGCDSIYELHLFIHPTYYFEKRDTMCYNENPDSLYRWPVQYGTDIRTIGLKDTVNGDMKWDAAAQAWIGTFRDTMFTQTCAECNGGLKGCDSIHALTLIIPKAYYFNDTATWCKLHYDPVLGDTVHQYYRWMGKDHSGRDSIRGELRETNDYYDRFITRYGCDSVYHIRLDYLASAELYERTDTTICSVKDGIFEWKDHNGVVLKTYPLDEPIFIDEYDDSRCDTVYAINLTVIPSYYIVDTVMKTQEDTCYWPVTGKSYGGTKTTLPYDSLITTDTTFVVRHFLTNPVNGVQCDSTRVLFLRIGSVFRDTVSAFACGTETSYDWIETRPEYFGPDGVPFLRKTITDLPAQKKDSIYEHPFLTTLGYDSIFYLRLYRAPSYLNEVYMSVCQDTAEQFKWDGHPDVDPFPLKQTGTHILYDKQKTDSFQCDSIWRLYLTIHPVYTDTTPVYHTCQFSSFRWEDQDPSFVAPDSILDADNNRVRSIPTYHAGDFIYALKFHTIHGCDSTRYLKLHIDSVYTVPVDTTERSMCDNEVLPFFDRFIYGVNAPDRPLDPDSVVEVPAGKAFFTFDTTYTATSELGCDSAVLHRITIYRTYLKEELDSVCQGTVYSWHDTVIQTETLKSDSIYVFYDSLHTTEHGCDSIHVLRLRIDSVYHIYNNKLLCDYDTTSWQGQYYRGEKFEGTAAEKAKYKIVVKSDTTYLDTVTWNTIHKCDSIFYLTLRVAPSYDTTVYDTVCDNENRHIFIFSDTQGNYFRDSIGYEPHIARAEKDTSTTHYPIVRHTLHHTLKTVEGCDSVVHFELTIKPTYLFENKGKGCFGDAITWRGREISSSNVYYDRLTTQDGCDSVFKLDYFIKPFISIPIHKDICDNYSFFHYDTLFRDDGSIRIVATEVWSPGRPRPDVDDAVDVHFPGIDGCDSIVYKYYLTFHHAYLFNDSAKSPVCSGEAYYSDSLNHEWSDWVKEYDVDTFVQPYDTVFIDSLFTEFGCDSVYRLKAHVVPSYRHITYDTICSNETYIWHSRLYGDSILSGLNPGVYQLCDSFYTIDHCDSIYEMRLQVNTAYFEEDSLNLCADETLQWRSHYFEHMTPGEYFVADSLTSENGCDSIYHLYLTVADTTFEINIQQICIGDTLVVGEHHYTQDGWYKDTTINEAGCHHFIYTHIEVIPPTVPAIWVENAMCQSETAFELQYIYTSAPPLSYSVYFDEKGHEAGFEDIEDMPITAYSDTMVISIPIPYRDGDKTQYPRPDLYPIRLVVDNGICQHKETDCSADSYFLLSYPKWLLEQRHGDVIAILNEKYNGGYTWTSYRWYQDGILMPEQTKPYLHLPDGLVPGATYHVELQREGEELLFPTCAIEAHANVIDNDFAPTMGYLSVTPTYVCTAHPYTYILSRKDGSYRVTSAEGMFVSEGVFRADVTEIEVPQKEGMYIVQLWSNDTPEEPYRAIKILVNSKCIE